MKNDRRKAQRAAYEARQEREGKNVILWIIAVLLVLALAFLGYYAAVIA